METFTGDVIEESLTDRDILQCCEIRSTRVSSVTESHRTPWLQHWTIHSIAIGSEKVNEFAVALSGALDTSHPGSWYVDFKSEKRHYVVYPNKIFLIDRSDLEQYRRATEYGISIGIPEHQVDFEPHFRKAI